MSEDSASLARSITWVGSKQTYIIARLLVDKELVNDFMRAYAYFRWMDNIIDVSEKSAQGREAFIQRQSGLIDSLYKNEIPDDLLPEEEILADLISHDTVENSGLKSFICNMFAIIEFDVYRKGKLISSDELAWYTERLSRSVIDGLLFFIGNECQYPMSKSFAWII